MGARRYEVTRSIDAPASSVWSLLIDADNYAQWNKAVMSIEGQIREGDAIKLISVADPKRKFKLKVAEMRGPHHMLWSGGMPLGLFTGKRTYTINENGDAQCDFTMVEEFVGPLAGPITKSIPDLTDSFAIFADSLKAAAETARRS